MIQRIQSVFLALAAIADLGLFGLPFASTPAAVPANPLFADQAYSVQDNAGLLLFFLLAGLLALASIFLYRNRRMQMRLTIFSTIALVAGIALCLIFFLNNQEGLADVAVNDQMGAYLPIAGLVFSLLAYRYINKDEKLVQSMDRLR